MYAASSIPLSNSRVDKFNDYYKSVYGYFPGSVSTFTWHGYDLVDALTTVIKSVAIIGADGNLYIPREKLVQAVNNMEGYEGLTGTISCHAGECNVSGPFFLVVNNGEWVLP